MTIYATGDVVWDWRWKRKSTVIRTLGEDFLVLGKDGMEDTGDVGGNAYGALRDEVTYWAWVKEVM